MNKPKSKSGIKPTLLTHPETGETLTRREWAEKLGIKLDTLQQQINRGDKGLSKRKWYEYNGPAMQGPRLAVALVLNREYEHRTNGLRCWLEWFTPDDDVELLGRTRKVMIRICGNDPSCSQTMTHEVFSKEFKLVGSPKPTVKTPTPEQLNFKVESRNRFRKSPQLIPVIKHEGPPDRKTRTRPSAHTKLLSEIAKRK
jgi:hypothetical protein